MNDNTKAKKLASKSKNQIISKNSQLTKKKE